MGFGNSIYRGKKPQLLRGKHHVVIFNITTVQMVGCNTALYVHVLFEHSWRTTGNEHVKL